MNTIFNLLLFFHVISFVFMSVPLFNLIVVNERGSFGPLFNYHLDRYMENIIKNGAYRCFIFQSTVFITGILLLIYGPLGISALWTNWVVLLKTILLIFLTIMLSYVHLNLQPKIEALLSDVDSESKIPENLMAQLKPYRVRRKWLATFCLFIVITLIILGLQVYDRFNPYLTVGLIGSVGLFVLKANKTLLKFGWI